MHQVASSPEILRPRRPFRVVGFGYDPSQGRDENDSLLVDGIWGLPESKKCMFRPQVALSIVPSREDCIEIQTAIEATAALRRPGSLRHMRLPPPPRR